MYVNHSGMLGAHMQYFLLMRILEIYVFWPCKYLHGPEENWAPVIYESKTMVMNFEATP